jgi:hypothetical protein
VCCDALRKCRRIVGPFSARLCAFPAFGKLGHVRDTAAKATRTCVAQALAFSLPSADWTPAKGADRTDRAAGADCRFEASAHGATSRYVGELPADWETSPRFGYSIGSSSDHTYVDPAIQRPLAGQPSKQRDRGPLELARWLQLAVIGRMVRPALCLVAHAAKTRPTRYRCLKM